MNSTRLKLAAGLFLAGIVLFGQSINDPFHFDDALILNDTNISTPANWTHFFNPLHVRQLTYFSFYLNHLFAGPNPASYHLENVILHGLNAALFFILLTAFLEQRLALIAALFFLVHPIQTEPVMLVYQRSTLLACFFSLLAMLALQRKRTWLAVVLFFLAFESKETALIVPLLYATIFIPDRMRRTVVVILIIALAAGALGVLVYQRETTVGVGAFAKMSPLTYLTTETRVMYTYLRLLVFPIPQSLEYSFRPRSLAEPKVWVMIAGLIGILAAGAFLVRTDKWRLTGLAMLAYFVLLAPSSSLIPSRDLAFEHRLYIPMMAVSIFLVSLLSKIKRPEMVAAPVLAILCILTLNRGTVWATDASLWEDAVSHAPRKARAWFNLGGAYIDTDPERARAAYNRAIELLPDYARAHYNLGVIDQAKKNYPAAAASYEKSVAIDPNYWPAWNNLGNSLFPLGRLDQAIAAFNKTLELNPDHWPARYSLAILYFNSGRFEQSIPYFRSVLDWRPDFRDARFFLAEALTRSGKPEEAAAEREKLKANQGAPARQ